MFLSGCIKMYYPQQEPLHLFMCMHDGKEPYILRIIHKRGNGIYMEH